MPNEVRNSKFLVLEKTQKIFNIGSKLMISVVSAFSGVIRIYQGPRRGRGWGGL